MVLLGEALRLPGGWLTGTEMDVIAASREDSIEFTGISERLVDAIIQAGPFDSI